MNFAVLRDIGTLPIDADIERVVHETKCIAMVGLSPNEMRPAWGVARYLKSQGYRVIPVNPGHAGKQLLDEVVYPDLASIPREIDVDMLDIFRRPDAVPAIVEQAITWLPKLRTVWLQLGITHAQASERGRAYGLTVIEDRCPKIEFPRYL